MYKIIEIANTHAGDEQYMLDLISSFATEKDQTGIKFQPFKYDRIATPDFEWYPVYEELFFSPEQWKRFIGLANETKDVWLDLFDDYGVEILRTFKAEVYGIKLQTSVLSNWDVLKALKEVDISDKILIINIASRTLEDIHQWVEYFRHRCKVKELWLEVGFQAYPTDLKDSGLNKIAVIKEQFGKTVVFADHLDGSTEDALWLPVMAVLQGADVIEKHVMLGDRPTKYDHFSSLTPERFFQMSANLNKYAALIEQPFINEKEREYLFKSEMKPLLKRVKKPGQLVNPAEDLLFRRSGKDGLTSSGLKEMFQGLHILQTSKNEGETLLSSDFKKAKIAAIIACRLKSSRLKSKALLEIGSLTSVEYCLRNALRFTNVDEVILATSTVEQDAPLEQYTYSKDVIFHRGHPEDVIQRYLDIIRKNQIDVIVRITADMPYVDDEVLQILLKSHFETGADYTASIHAAAGTNLEIINAEAMERVKSYFPSADYSEYMTWYFQNNPEEFHLNIVDLPEIFVRKYRLTLDYQEDLDLFNAIESHFQAAGKTEFHLRDVINFLDSNPDIAAINSHLTLRYKTDQELIDTLNRVTKIHKA